MILNSKKILVIPDVHLKPWMFDEADEILQSGQADGAVCLGDLEDDFGKQYMLEAYESTFEKAIDFDKKYPTTLWCIANHDLSYLYDYSETGYSVVAKYVCISGLRKLMEQAGERIAYAHRINNCVFSHGGISKEFAELYFNEEEMKDIDKAIDRINRMKPQAMWHDNSPIWLRPTYSKCELFMPEYFQITGHTPVKEPTKYKSLIILDTYSTYRDGTPYGNQKMVIVDTIKKTWKYAGKK